MNRVNLSKGEIVFGRWKNKDKNIAAKRAFTNPELLEFKDEKMKENYANIQMTEWLVAYSIQNGEGFLKGATVEETFNNIQNLDIVDAQKLGEAFKEFLETELQSVKKK